MGDRDQHQDGRSNDQSKHAKIKDERACDRNGTNQRKLSVEK
jgi:hypothetical protein